MVDFKKLTDRAKQLVEKRGGTDSLKEDAAELKNIARGQGSLADKAKAAAAAMKEPGGGGEETKPKPVPAEPTERTGVAEERTERRERRAQRRKERGEQRGGGGEPA